MKMQELKKKHARVRKNEPDRFLNLCQSQCRFLFNNYTDIFNKAHKDELDLNIMGKLLDVLKKIEDGLVDQHEGSVMVGTILKELYVDSHLEKAGIDVAKFKEQIKQINPDLLKEELKKLNISI
jgi:hypothetical protein